MAANRLLVRSYFNDLFPMSTGFLECGDAFRHSFFSALNASSISCGPDLALAFGNAHESESPLDQESEMDFWNNNEGFLIASTSPDNDAETLANLVCANLTAGSMRMFFDPTDETSSFPLINTSSCACMP